MAKLHVNGQVRDVAVEADTPLLWVLREQVGLTGTKYGCGVAQCGACSVHINGEVMRSCSIPVGSVKASDKIVTIEGLAQNGILHKVQKAWIDHDVPQCGYCQSGQIMAAAALLKKKPRPTVALSFPQQQEQPALERAASPPRTPAQCDGRKPSREATHG